MSVALDLQCIYIFVYLQVAFLCFDDDVVGVLDLPFKPERCLLQFDQGKLLLRLGREGLLFVALTGEIAEAGVAMLTDGGLLAEGL